MNLSKNFILTFWIFVLVSNIQLSTVLAQSKKNNEDSLAVKKFEDSLRSNLIVYLDTMQSYDQAITFLKDKKKLDKSELNCYYNLIKKREHTKWLIDSLKLVIAEKYKINDLSDQAEVLFSDLLKSNYSVIRNKAILETDSLLIKKKKGFYEEYPFSPITNVLKPVIPVIIALALIALPFYVYNRRKNKNSLAVYCSDEQEAVAFRTAVKAMLEEVQSRLYQEELDSSVVSPGAIGTLPHFESEASPYLKNLFSATIPEQYMKALGFVWRCGISPYYMLSIFIEKQEIDVLIKGTLIGKKIIISEWNKVVPKNLLFDTRLDIAYEVLIEIQNDSVND